MMRSSALPYSEGFPFMLKRAIETIIDVSCYSLLESLFRFTAVCLSLHVIAKEI